MMRTLFNIRLLAAIAAACALPVIGIALSLALDPKLVRFEHLKYGDQYWDAHPKLGFKLFTKVGNGIASSFRQTCSGRQHNDFVTVRGSHKVRKVSHVD